MNSGIIYRPFIIHISSKFFEDFPQDIFKIISLGITSLLAVINQSWEFLIYQ